MTYKGDSVTVLCCGEPMRKLGPWPHRDTDILVTKFHCNKCRNSVDILEPHYKIVDGKQEAA